MSSLWKMLILGFPVGLAFGYVLQRGRFCMNSALRDIGLNKDLTLFRAYVLALLVQMVAVRAVAATGLYTLEAVAPFFWQGTLMGGFIFGVGMSFAGG